MVGPIEGGATVAFVNQDHTCVSCGYNLRTLSMEAKCPECATPVRQSFLSDHLVYSNPAWLKSIARGTLLISIVAGISVIMLFFGIFDLKFGGGQGPTVVDFAKQALLILTLIGVVLLTTKCPDPRTGMQDPLSRRICRWATVSWVLLLLFYDALGIGQLSMTNTSLSDVVTLGKIAGTIVVAASLMRYLSNVAEKSNSPNLRGLGVFIMYGILSPPCLFILIMIAEAIGLGTWLLGGIEFCIVPVLGFTLLILTGFFLLLLNLALREDLKNALATWKPIEPKHESD